MQSHPLVEQAKGLPGDLLDNSVRVNMALQVQLLKSDELIAHALQQNQIKIVGARYDLGTGRVEVTVS